MQNRQLRVQVSPKIKNVAVPEEKHSCRLGQLASLQTVESPCSFNRAEVVKKRLSEARGRRSHAGLRRGALPSFLGALEAGWVMRGILLAGCCQIMS